MKAELVEHWHRGGCKALKVGAHLHPVSDVAARYIKSLELEIKRLTDELATAAMPPKED